MSIKKKFEGEIEEVANKSVIDHSQLTNRDWNSIDILDFKKYYIEENHSNAQTIEHFNIKPYHLTRLLHKFNIKKSRTDVLKLSAETKLHRYGSATYNNKEKEKLTKLIRYGDANYSNRDKVKETLIARYGSVEESYKIRTNKTALTNLNKYGVNCVFKKDDIKNKIKNCIHQKYGVDYYVQTAEFKEKSKQTFLNKYGVDNPMKNDSIKDKVKISLLKLYKNGKIDLTKIKHARKYTYKDINFDSSWELALYIYLKDNSIEFEYQPNVCFEYLFNGKSHIYKPDFRINGKLYEIKSDYLYECMTNKNIKGYSDKLNCKYICMCKNNIIILKKNEILKYITYINNTYGKEYLQSFRNKCEVT